MRARPGLAFAWLLVFAVLCGSTSLLAAPPSEKPAGKPPMDEKAMMEMYMKAATPGAEHQQLAKMAGNWKLDVTTWQAPGAPPQKSTGTAKYESLLGGRYLQQTVHGEMGGQPYDGIGIEGFDNVTKESWSVWFDSMSTGGMTSRGKCAVGAKTCTFTGHANDPLTGKPTKFREVVAHDSDDKLTFDMYGADPTGKEFHMMRIVYTRQ